MNSRDTSKHLS